MERQRSSRPGSEILYALQKLKEILQQKNKQFALFELDVHSSQNNLSAVKSMKSNASSSKHKAIDELRLVEEISENFTGADAAVKKEERGMHKVINGEKLLTRARSSNGVSKMSLANTSRGKIHRNSHEGKQVLQGNEIEQLRERLKFLEEESKIMKQEFLEHVEEKKKFVKEIYKQFRTIHRCLQLENPVYGGRDFDGSFIANPCQVEAGLETGLSKILCQDSIACNVTSDQRTNILALKKGPEETWVHAQNE
ncbi:uncharacterized protein LOC110648212 isoform X1 [Hevea brasiliensis]|uniref:uncharacterized protein LOC110648212 isoform X1 n=1 Tax=Hevea brasiliensis TaxID=3981 RepID=UPI0025E1624F|nr:uncharacterized protein LOC110648212 isoform X1 [Hevea brasiliensis]